MAINAEQLNIILAARDKEFTKAMDRSQKRVEMFANKSNKSLSKTSKSLDALGGAARRLAPLLAGAFSLRAINNTINAAVEIGNLSAVAGVSTDRFQELAFASRAFGVQQEKLSDILKDVNDKFGDYVQTGAGPLKDFFEFIAPQVGLTAEAFADLSSAEKLGKYISALESANVSQADMTFYLEAIASDATLLKGVFADNGTELDRLANKLRNTGGVMDRELIDNAREAREEIDLASTAISANLSVAIAEILPLVTSAAEGLAGLATSVGSILDKINIARNMDSSKGIYGTIIEDAEKYNEALRDELTLVKTLQQRQEAIFGQGKMSEPAGVKVGLDLDNAVMALKAAYDKLERNKPSFSATVTDGSVIPSDAPSTSPRPRARPTTEPTQTDRSALNAIDDLRNSYRDLLESADEALKIQNDYNDAVKMLDTALSAGAISQEQYNAGIAAAKQNFDRATAGASELSSVMATVESSMEDAFMSMIDGTSSASDAFKSMASSILKELFRVLVVQRLVGSVGGGGIAGAIGGAFGLASGGVAQAGQPYVTGEHGRELFVPAQNGRVLSVAQSKDAISGGNGEGITVVQNNTFGSGVTRAEVNAMLPKMVEATKAAVVDAKLRGGSYGGAFS